MLFIYTQKFFERTCCPPTSVLFYPEDGGTARFSETDDSLFCRENRSIKFVRNVGTYLSNGSCGVTFRKIVYSNILEDLTRLEHCPVYNDKQLLAFRKVLLLPSSGYEQAKKSDSFVPYDPTYICRSSILSS
jgi:hypothetical protein